MRISDWSSDVCSSDLHGDGEVLPPVLAEVQVSAAAAAADGDDAPLDQLEAAEPLAGRLGAAHGIEGVSPDAAAGSARLTLERQHLRDGAAIVGEAVDPRQAGAQQLALAPAPTGLPKVRAHPALDVRAPPADRQHVVYGQRVDARVT